MTSAFAPNSGFRTLKDATANRKLAIAQLRTFERPLIDHVDVSQGSEFMCFRTRESEGKHKNREQTASKENSTMLDAQQNDQQRTRTATIRQRPGAAL